MTAANKKLISAEHVFVDSTHVKASANKRKFEKKIVRKETRAYQGRLQEEINQNRENHGKKPFPPDKFDKEETKEIKESITDSESGYYVKDERTKQTEKVPCMAPSFFILTSILLLSVPLLWGNRL